MAPVEPHDLIDLAHYSSVSGRAFDSHGEAYAHFAAEGEAAGLNPSPFLYTTWYRWQNPDVAQFPTSLDHFVAVSGHRPVDPAPFIDMVLCLRRAPQGTTPISFLKSLVTGQDTSISPKTQDHYDALSTAQARIHKAVKSRLFGQPSGVRKRLVWVQAGSSFKAAKWFKPDAKRSWDLLCNWYSLARVDLRFGEMQLRQSGTKATGIYHALTHYADILAQYDQVLFLDDDLELRHKDLDQVFDLADAYAFDMFQPSVAKGSNCVWPDLFQKKLSKARETTAVEIMMPGFSRRGLELCTAAFGTSVSGFGLDFECSELIRANGWKCGVIDAVAAKHLEVIDEGGGAYYEFMRALGINQKLELFQTIETLGKLPEFATIRPARRTAT